MSTRQSFGGPWTVEKLDILSKYLNAYVRALKNQPFDLIYIDAFAGTGHIMLAANDSKRHVSGQIGLDMLEAEEPKEEIIEGSATLALRTPEQFSNYYFIEKDKDKVAELDTLVKTQFPQRSSLVTIFGGQDCNNVLLDLCRVTDWRKTRAVLFLDPYAAEVKWETLKAVASTQAIDIWYLFPLHVVIRMMARDGKIDPSWRPKLNSIFGDSSWEQEIYETNPQISMFDEPSVKRDNDIEKLKRYIEKQLGTVFKKVSTHSRVLLGRTNNPLFLFCFAVSNPSKSAQDLALKVADHILLN